MSDEYGTELGTVIIDENNIICKIKGKGEKLYKAVEIRVYIYNGTFDPDCVLEGYGDDNKDDVEVETIDRISIVSHG